MTNKEKWEAEALKNPELMKGLKAMKKAEEADAFNGDLSFGTGGMRGVMGLGTNRMNIYTLRKANYGLGAFFNAI